MVIAKLAARRIIHSRGNRISSKTGRQEQKQDFGPGWQRQGAAGVRILAALSGPPKAQELRKQSKMKNHVIWTDHLTELNRAAAGYGW